MYHIYGSFKLISPHSHHIYCNVTKGQSLCHPHKNGRANGAPIHSIPFSPT